MIIILNQNENIIIQYKGTEGTTMVSFEEDATRIRTTEFNMTEEDIKEEKPIHEEWFAGYGAYSEDEIEKDFERKEP